MRDKQRPKTLATLAFKIQSNDTVERQSHLWQITGRNAAPILKNGQKSSGSDGRFEKRMEAV